MAGPKAQPQVYLGRSLGATELQIPAITQTVVSMSPTGAAADTQSLGTILPSMLVRIAATDDIYLRFSSDASAATTADTLFTRGVEAQLVPFDATSVSTIAVSNPGAEVTVTLFQ